MSVLRQASASARTAIRVSTCLRTCTRVKSSSLLFSRPTPTQTRSYAKKAKSTANLVPGSKQPITDEAAREEYKKCEEKMKAAVDWYRKECASVETRASGRVTPALLAPVRVKLPDADQLFRLDEVATVGIKDGSLLLVTVFEEGSLKHVERAIYEAKLPNITPQKHDNRTLKIPVPKPTVEARTSLVTAAQRQAEDSRMQIRKHHQASLKRGKYEKHSIELEEFQKLTDKHVGEIDAILTQLKKSTGVSKK
ncbi:ribosome recycling factor [Dendrothele bispora CBS 962.96]|uniref:Ribosome recycling factor n=1 Tax=Dendrothele bispora (strain CBS 962.96) TaxID=1314807 RepID=A0A4V4HIL2_DENBC|nr:ribosome recycling factor [Dendrothele bispora CBS 962.96]